MKWRTSGKSGIMGIFQSNMNTQLFKGLTPVTAITFSPDGQKLAAGSGYGPLRLWDTDSRNLLTVLETHGATISTISFLPDGKQLVVASTDNAITL